MSSDYIIPFSDEFVFDEDIGDFTSGSNEDVNITELDGIFGKIKSAQHSATVKAHKFVRRFANNDNGKRDDAVHHAQAAQHIHRKYMLEKKTSKHEKRGKAQEARDKKQEENYSYRQERDEIKTRSRNALDTLNQKKNKAGGKGSESRDEQYEEDENRGKLHSDRGHDQDDYTRMSRGSASERQRPRSTSPRGRRGFDAPYNEYVL